MGTYLNLTPNLETHQVVPTQRQRWILDPGVRNEMSAVSLIIGWMRRQGWFNIYKVLNVIHHINKKID